jgi:hypothetical protein
MGIQTWTDDLMIYAQDEPTFASLAKDFLKESPRRSAEMANSAKDVPRILARYCNLQQLFIYSHGNVGYVHFAGGGITEANVGTLTGHPQLFLKAGRALFIGCNVGEGDAGLKFLTAAGRALFRGHGGIVGATNSKNLMGRWGLFDARVPPWGSLRLVQLDASGNVLNSKDY